MIFIRRVVTDDHITQCGFSYADTGSILYTCTEEALEPVYTPAADRKRNITGTSDGLRIVTMNYSLDYRFCQLDLKFY